MHRPTDAEAILRRAAQIEADRLDPAATLSDADLLEAGRAAGLSEDAVRQAITEQRLAGASVPLQQVPSDLRWAYTRRVPRLTDGQRAEMFSAVRRAKPYTSMSATAQIETFGEAQQLAFDVPISGTWARVRVSPDGDDHDVVAYEHNAHADIHGMGWLVGLASIVPALLLVAPVMVTFEAIPNWIGFVAMALIVALSLLTTPTFKRRTLARRRRQFEALSADLDRIVASPGDTVRAAPALSLDALGEAPVNETSGNEASARTAERRVRA